MKKHLHSYYALSALISIGLLAIPFDSVQAVGTDIVLDNTLTVNPVLPNTVPDPSAVGTIHPINQDNGQGVIDQVTGQGNLFFSFGHFNIGAGDTAYFNLHNPGTVDINGNPVTSWENVIARVTGGLESFIDGTLRVSGIRITNNGNPNNHVDYIDGISGATTIVNGAKNFFLINPAGITFGNGSVVDVPGSFYASTSSSVKFKDGSTFGMDQPGHLVSGLTASAPDAFGFLGNETGALILDHAKVQVFNDETLSLVGRDVSINASTVGQVDLTTPQAGFNEDGTPKDPNAFDSNNTNTYPRFVSKGPLFIDGIQLLLFANHGNRDVKIFDHNPNDFLDQNGDPDPFARTAYNNNLVGTLNNLDGTINVLNTNLINAGGDSEEITFIRGGNINLTNASVVSSNYGDDCGGICQNDGAGESVPGTSGIDILATGNLAFNNGHIVTETSFSRVNPAADNVAINIQAASILMDHGSTISTRSLNIGNINADYKPAGILAIPLALDPQAGNINIKVVDGKGVYGNFTAQGGSSVVSSTETFGNAGKITIDAGSIALNNAHITSESTSTSNHLTGYVMDVSVNHHGDIQRRYDTNTSTAADPDYIYGRTETYQLLSEDHNRYTSPFNTASPLTGDVPDGLPILLTEDNKAAGAAGDISLTAHNGDIILSNGSTVSTNAVFGNGGNIDINGDIIELLNSAITTSVLGPQGNGGNINVTANYLIMDSGFIQANTAALGGTGGLVNVNVGTLIPSGGSIIIGGNIRYDFQPYSGLNVIQAAAPNGLSGQVNATSPQLNLSGTLANLIVQSFDPNAISRNICAIGESSSLGQSGKGGLRRRAKDALISTPSSVSF